MRIVSLGHVFHTLNEDLLAIFSSPLMRIVSLGHMCISLNQYGIFGHIFVIHMLAIFSPPLIRIAIFSSSLMRIVSLGHIFLILNEDSTSWPYFRLNEDISLSIFSTLNEDSISWPYFTRHPSRIVSVGHIFVSHIFATLNEDSISWPYVHLPKSVWYLGHICVNLNEDSNLLAIFSVILNEDSISCHIVSHF